VRDGRAFADIRRDRRIDMSAQVNAVAAALDTTLYELADLHACF
jgi:hypothetical protein